MNQITCPICQKHFRTNNGLEWHLSHVHSGYSSEKQERGQHNSVDEKEIGSGDPPQCPECGSDMVLRTARKGSNAGKQFWGCSNYPRCKAIVDINGTDELSAVSGTPSGVSPNISHSLRSIPRAISLAPRTKGLQTKIYQTGALPAVAVNMIHHGDLPRIAVREAMQWRLDFPLPKSLIEDDEMRVVLSIAESLLTRGTTPYCLPSMETLLSEHFNQIDNGLLESGLRSLASVPLSPFVAVDFDSTEEEQLYDLMAGWNENHDSKWHVIPQVHLSSLAPGLTANQEERVDFFVTRPGESGVVIEVDGDSHKTRGEQDNRRDTTLANIGVKVFRIPASEIRRESGVNLDLLKSYLSTPSDFTEESREVSGLSETVMALRLYKLVHEIQLTIIEAIRGGWLVGSDNNISVIVPEQLKHIPELEEVLKSTGESFSDLIQHLCNLYNVPDFIGKLNVSSSDKIQEEPIILIASASEDTVYPKNYASIPHFLISDILLPCEVSVPASATSPFLIEQPKKEQVQWFLNYIFRKEEFWEGQWEAIERTLQGKDSVVLLPTGGGKTIAFQLAALLLPGRCIVVDPIISLIDDQIDNLRRVGIDRCVGITSQIQSQQVRDYILGTFSSGHYLFTYIAPERFQTAPFREQLRALTVIVPVSAIVVDEAHCVSEWGHDFRTAYLNLGRISRQFCSFVGITPPLIALTGTASKIVLKDVQRELGITAFDAIITPITFDRQELHYLVVNCHSTEKNGRLLGFLNRLPSEFGISRTTFFHSSSEQTASGLVFCPFVGTELGVVEQSHQLTQDLGVQVAYYSGGAPHGFDDVTWNQIKQETARRFKRNEIAVMACTKAYGMGIDKPNIRYTAHIGLPDSIESFYQEAGRAGRDRQKAECAIILSDDFPKRTEQLLNPGTSLEEIALQLDSMEREDSDDITRALWFHTNSFRGEQAEASDMKEVISRLGKLDTKRTAHLSAERKNSSSPRGLSRERMEKVLHRLVVIGAVEDYTVRYPVDFDVIVSGAARDEIAKTYGTYAGAYSGKLGEEAEKEATGIKADSNENYVFEVAKLLIHFVYTHIERARRSSLREMLLAARVAVDGEDLRSRILDYLEHSDFDPRLDEVIGSSRGGIDVLSPLLEDLVSPSDAAELRGSVARLLSSYPDNPGLLMLRAIAEALSRDGDLTIARQDFRAAIEFGIGEYRLDRSELGEACGRIIETAIRKEGIAEVLLTEASQAKGAGRILIREIMANLSIRAAWMPAAWLLTNIISCSSEIRNMGRNAE